MPAHKHAELMLQYAQDAAETDSPWERWEVWLITHNKWAPMTEGNMAWWSDATYRRKPKTIMCNGFEIEAPLDDSDINEDVIYFLPCVSGSMYFASVKPRLFPGLIQRGIIHTTKEAAIAHAKAMLGIDPNKGE